ncbi:MAG: hypothetical protein ACI4DY_12225, partial [Monoglobaceae bacterium]
MNFYQACYGKPHGGWDIFNVSNNTPARASRFFESIGSSCTPQNVGSIYDDDGNPLLLYELVSDNEYICALMSKYGENDEFGRPKCFVHGFIFDAQGLFVHPEAILSLSKSNFKFDEESTKETPATLASDVIPSINDSALIGLDKEKWVKLMKCVYKMLNVATNYPIYIKYNGDFDTMRRAMYCILSALPYSLRYLLSFSNADSFGYTKFKPIMFVKSVPKNANYFDLSTGETNINYSDIEDAPEDNPALWYFAEHTADEFQQYCSRIQNIMEQVGLDKDPSVENVKTAHILYTGITDAVLKSDDRLLMYLLYLLKSLPMNNLFADDYIAEVLAIMNEREIIPNEGIMKNIERRNDNSPSEHYTDCCKYLSVNALLKWDEREQLAALKEQFVNNKDKFNEWVSLLMKKSSGVQIVEKYFANEINSCNSYDTACDKYFLSKSYLTSSNLLEITKNVLRRIIKKTIVSYSLARYNFKLEFDKFSAAFLKVLEKDGADSDELIKQEKDILSKDFWKTFDFDEFEFDDGCISNCEYMMPPKADCRVSDFELLADIYDAANNSIKTKQNVDVLCDCIKKFGDDNTLEADELKVVVQKIQTFIVNTLRSDNVGFNLWYELAKLNRENNNPI